MTDFPFILLCLVGLVIAIVYSPPQEQVKKFFITILDRMMVIDRKFSTFPLYLLPVVLCGWLLEMTVLLIMVPFLAVYYIRSRSCTR
jgi:hypothetical protein